MLCHCYLKKGVVYLPTVVNQGTAVYMDIEPVRTVRVADTEGLRRALGDTMSKPNAFVPPSIEDARKPPVMLKYTGDRSWSALQRSGLCWDIQNKDGQYKIAGHRIHEGRYWKRDPKQTIQFPPGTTADDVVDRVIGILQDAARQ
jgi:hypothetical protein